MKLADAERKRKDAEERLDDMAAEIRLPGGKKIKFAWGGLANHPEAMARASLEKAKMAVLAADPDLAPKVPPKKRDCSGIPIAECSRWTVEYLVTECKRRGLRHAGKKPELVARLLVDLDFLLVLLNLISLCSHLVRERVDAALHHRNVVAKHARSLSQIVV